MDTPKPVSRLRWDEDYSDADRTAIIDYLNITTERKDLSNKEITAAVNKIELEAKAYSAREFAHTPWPPPAEQIKMLRDIERISNKLLETVENLQPLLWLAIADRVVGFSEQEKETIRSHGYGGIIRDLPMFGFLPGIADAAGRAYSEMEKERRKPGPKGDKLVVFFAWKLAPIYEEVIRKKAAANYSENYDGQLGKRATPFVRFVALCLRPYNPEKVNSSLGEAIFNGLFKKRKSRN